MDRFAGKVALVTGAASGIGRATALRLGSEGARLLLADINPDGLEETVTALGSDIEASSTVLDVTDSSACNAVVETCAGAFGQLDVLCNIAGIPLCQHMAEITDEQWQRQVAVNLSGVFYMCRAEIGRAHV